MRLITVLGTAIAALLLSTPLAVAQGTPEVAPEDCYVEWESNVRVNLESLCNRSNPAAGTQQPAIGAVGDRTAETSSAPASPPTLTVRVISDVGSTVYSNGVSASRRYIPQLPTEQTANDFPPGTLQPSPPSRRYVSYQIFYPNPYFGWGQFGHHRRRFSPSPDAATPPSSPTYYNPSPAPILQIGAPIVPPLLFPRIDQQQQRIRY